MREPPFWWSGPGLKAWLLQPAALVYGFVAARRMRRAGARAAIPVFCVGNFVLGGAGKTPAAIAIARLLSDMGERPWFLTRGYGGSLAGPVQVDPKTHRSAQVGDEPLLLARVAPVAVAHDRVAGARLAAESGASVIVMDDGLQNPSLAKDCSIAVVDVRRATGNGFVFPAGPLRAPLRTQRESVDAILLVGDTRAPVSGNGRSVAEGSKPVLRGRIEPEAAVMKSFERRKVLAFAGIGDPEKFFMMLAGAGVEATIERSFPDHHRYTAQEAAELLAECERRNLLPVTTEKDLVRLDRDEPAVARLAAKAVALPVNLVFQDEASIRKILRQALAAARARQDQARSP